MLFFSTFFLKKNKTNICLFDILAFNCFIGWPLSSSEMTIYKMELTPYREWETQTKREKKADKNAIFGQIVKHESNEAKWVWKMRWMREIGLGVGSDDDDGETQTHCINIWEANEAVSGCPGDLLIGCQIAVIMAAARAATHRGVLAWMQKRLRLGCLPCSAKKGRNKKKMQQ